MTRRLILWSAVPVLMLIGFFLLGAQSASAANYYYVGTTDNFGTAASWHSSEKACDDAGDGSVPGSGDAIYFMSDCNVNVTVPAGAYQAIYAETGHSAEVDLGGNVNLSRDGSDNSVIFQSGTTLDANGYTINLEGHWEVNSGAVFIHGDGDVIFDGSSGDQNLYAGGNDADHDFYDLTISNSGGNYVDTDGDLDVDNDYTVSSGAQAGLLDGGITVGGTVSNEGTIQAESGNTFSWTLDTDSGTVEYYDDGGGSNTGLGGGTSYYNLRFEDDSNSSSWTLNAGIDVDGSFTINNTATLDAAGYDMTIGGDWTNNGTFTSGTGTVTFDGTTATQNITTGGTGAGQDFYNVVVSSSGGDGATLDSAQAMDIDNDLTISSGATFDLADENLTVGNDFFNNGSLWLTYGETITLTNGMDTDSGTVLYLDDSGASRTGFNSGLGNTYYNLTLDDDSNSTDLTLNANLDVNGSLTLSNSYTLATGGNDINVGGDWTLGGSATYTHGNNEVIFDGTGDQTISGTNTFYDLTKQNAGGTFTIPSGVTTTVANDLGISGTTNNINFFSSSPTSPATITYSGTGTVSFLNVRGITNNAAVLSCLTSCQDFSSNTGWVFAEAAQQGSGSTLSFLTVLEPGSSDAFDGGDEITVTWTGAHNDTASAAVYYSMDAGETFELVADGLENTGSYALIVPNEATFKGMVKVALFDAEDNELLADQSGIFKVMASEGVEDFSEEEIIELLDELVEELLDSLGDSFDGLTQLLDTGAVTMLDTDGELQDLSAGALFRGESLSGVYQINADGSRSVFPNEATFLSHGYSFDDVVVVQDDQLQALPLGDRVRMAEGSLIKVQSDARVFQVGDNGEINHIPDEATALSLFGDEWNQLITDVNVVFWGDYTVGGSL